MNSCASTKSKFCNNKINIYNNDCFIPLPNYRTCPPPSMIIIAPFMVFPSIHPDCPPPTFSVPQPLIKPDVVCQSCTLPLSQTSCSTCN